MKNPKNHMNEIDPKARNCFYKAMKVVSEKVGNDCAEALILEHLIPSLVDYNEANFMHGYFRACAHMLPEYHDLFYNASSEMIHFKFFHYNEDGFNPLAIRPVETA